MFKVLKRFYLHSIRYRLEFFLSLIILSAMVIMFQGIYPGEEGLRTYIDVLDVLIGTINLQNPSYLLWILLGSALFIQYYMPLFAISFGAKILPFKERDGKELLLTQKKAIYSYYVENVVLVIGLLFLLILPSYLIILYDLSRNNALDSLPNVNTLFILAISIAVFFALLTGLGGILFFSRSFAYAIGGLYFVFSLIIGIITNSADIGSFADLSIIYRVNIIKNSLGNTLPIDVVAEILLICTIFIFVSLFALSRKNFIQRQSNIISLKNAENNRSNVAKKLLRYFYSPVNNVLGNIKQPILRDQMNVLSWIFSLSVIAITFVFAYLFVIYPGDKEVAIIMTGFHSPIITGPMFNHSIVPSIDGFLAMEIFAFTWLYYGPILLIATNSIALRDFTNTYSEITFSLPKTENTVYIWRTLGAIIYFLVLIVINLVGLIIVELIFNYSTRIEKIITVFLVIAIGYILFLVFFVTLVLLVPYKWGQRSLIVSFFYSIAMIIFAFAVNGLENLRFLSPFGYFDFVGIFYFNTPLNEIVPPILLFCIGVFGSFYLVIKYRVPKKDLV